MYITLPLGKLRTLRNTTPVVDPLDSTIKGIYFPNHIYLSYIPSSLKFLYTYLVHIYLYHMYTIPRFSRARGPGRSFVQKLYEL